MSICLLQANQTGYGLRDWESFCMYTNEDLQDGRLSCSCGENVDVFHWYWEKQLGNLHIVSPDDKEVLFHPIYSSGTAAVRGDTLLRRNVHHYWEIKMLTKVYGTDVMVGVGTSNMTLNERQYKFCSMLGYNDQSYGLSYRGTLQHDKLCRRYAPNFGLGSIVGVHLDMCAGVLEFYLNRKPLGVAFSGLKTKDVYPMVCSTAAQSSVKLICAMTLDSTLQMKCLAVIRKYPKLIRMYHNVPGLSKLIKDEYFWLLPPSLEDLEKMTRLSLEDEAVLPLSAINRRKRTRWLFEARADPDHVSYRDELKRPNNNPEPPRFSAGQYLSDRLREAFRLSAAADSARAAAAPAPAPRVGSASLRVTEGRLPTEEEMDRYFTRCLERMRAGDTASG